MYLDFWGWFFLIATIGTLLNSHFPIRPLFGRHHVLGAEVIFASLMATWAVRLLSNDPSPIWQYALLDVATGGIYLWIMLHKKAAWAALCVIIYALMGVTHISYVLSGQVNEYRYLQWLDGLFAMALITINTAIFAGRHVWGERMDRTIDGVLSGWTFSGLRVPRAFVSKG